VNTETQFGFKVLSEATRSSKARRKILPKKSNKLEKNAKKSLSGKNNLENETNDSIKSLDNKIQIDSKMINGRKFVINKRARQLLSKQDIIKNRKAFLDKTSSEFLKNISKMKDGKSIIENQDEKEENDKKEMVVNGRKVKIVRKPRKQDVGTKKSNVKNMTDKMNNHLIVKSNPSSLNKQEFAIQMSLPNPINLKPRMVKDSTLVQDKTSRVPYYKAFIQSRLQARKNRERLSSNSV